MYELQKSVSLSRMSYKDLIIIMCTNRAHFLNMKNELLYVMSMTAWKCYRCNLTFKEESHVAMHKEISRHDARQVEIPE